MAPAPRFVGDVLFLQWSARTETHEVTDMVHTFVFRDGLRVMNRCSRVMPEDARALPTPASLP